MGLAALKMHSTKMPQMLLEQQQEQQQQLRSQVPRGKRPMANRAKKVIEVNVNVNENKTANKINTHMKMQAAKGEGRSGAENVSKRGWNDRFVAKADRVWQVRQV